MAKSTTGGLSGAPKASTSSTGGLSGAVITPSGIWSNAALSGAAKTAPVTIAQINQSAVGPSKPAVTPVSTPVTISQIGQSAVGPQQPVSTPVTTTVPVSNITATTSVAPKVDASFSSNIDPKTGYPILNQAALDNTLKGKNTLTAQQYRNNSDAFGWNAKSDNSSVKTGAAIVGLKAPTKYTGVGSGVGSTPTEIITAAKKVGLDPANFTKTVTPELAMGVKGKPQTVTDTNALYNAIDKSLQGKYLVTNTTAPSKLNQQTIHASVLYHPDGKGNLVPMTDANGNASAATFKAVRTSAEGASGLLPILGIGALAFGLPSIMSAISGAGVSTATLGAVGDATEAASGLSVGDITNAGDLVAKSTSSMIGDVAKDIGSTLIRQQAGKIFGKVGGTIANIGLNAAGITGGINKGLASSLDAGTNINNITQNDTTGPTQGSTDYVDENGNVISANATNVSTGASGFPINKNLMETDGGTNYVDTSGVQYDQYGNPSTQMPSGSYVDSSGNVYDAAGNPAGNIAIGGNTSGVDLSGTLNNDGTITKSDGSVIDTSGNTVSTGGGTTGGGGVKPGGGGGGGGVTPSGGGGGTPITTGGTDWSQLANALSSANQYNVAGTLAQAAAAKYAADQQAAAAKYAQDLQQKRFETVNAQFAPQRGAGYSALNQIRGMLPGQYQQYDETGKPIGMATGTDYLTHQFTPQDLYAGLAPNYNFMLQQGQQAAQRQANLGGGALGGNALRALQEYTQNYAGNAYQNAFQNFQNQRTNIYNTLAGIAGIGQTAQNTTAQAGQAATNAISQLAVGGAGAQAAGITGAANAIAGGIQNYGANQILQAILNQKQDVANNPNLP